MKKDVISAAKVQCDNGRKSNNWL